MKKILITATVQSHVCQFHKPIMKALKEAGWEIHVAARNNLHEKNGLFMEYADKVYDVCFERSPLSSKNIKAYKQLKQIIDNDHYDIVQCNTPIVGVLARLAAAKHRKNGTRTIYIAHGFHFFKGAKAKNWILYYTIEKIFAGLTDVLVTINQEDYSLAKNKLKCKSIEYIPGLGIDTDKFKYQKDAGEKFRADNGIDDDAIMLFSVGELNDNKNHQVVINALGQLKNPKLFYFIAGNGKGKEKLEALINSLNLAENVKLVGYTRDIVGIYSAADIFILPSLREGLPMALMEAMSCGLPCIASDIRGVRDLIKNKQYLISENSAECFAEVIDNLSLNEDLRELSGKENLDYVANFDVKKVVERIKEIYKVS